MIVYMGETKPNLVFPAGEITFYPDGSVYVVDDSSVEVLNIGDQILKSYSRSYIFPYQNIISN